MEAKEMEKEGGNSSASKSWTPAEEAAIASVQEMTGCTRMQAIQKMRAGTSIVKHLKEMPLTDDQNKVLDQFEDYGRRWRKSLAEFVPIATAVRKMFEDKPRGVTIRGCSNQDDYFDKHLGISGRTIRSMFAEMGKTDQRFANTTTIELTDGEDGYEVKGDNEETSKPPRKTKQESDQVKGLKAALKAAKEEIRDFEKQLADAPKKIEKLEAQVRGQEAETNKQAGKALDAEKALKAAKDEIASLKKTVEKLEAELTKRGNLVTSQARTLDDLRKKLEASKNPPELRNYRKALIAAKVEARKSAKKDLAFEAIEETLDAANAEQIAVPDQEQKCDFSEDEAVAMFANGGK